jgi:hypothetical protein
LYAIWQADPAVRILVGGGVEGVSAAVREAESSGIPNVFAYIDRDYRSSNRARWSSPESHFRRFVSSAHEIENLLLDSDAMAGCSLNTHARTAEDIGRRLRERAEQLAWWAACRGIIADIREHVFGEFISHPTCEDVPNEDAAYEYVGNHGWWPGIRGYLSGVSDSSLRQSLIDCHANVLQSLSGDVWLREFPGKELLRHVRGWVYDPPNRREPTSILDSDFAKAIGQWQVENNAIPAELDELLAALRQRVHRR